MTDKPKKEKFSISMIEKAVAKVRKDPEARRFYTDLGHTGLTLSIADNGAVSFFFRPPRSLDPKRKPIRLGTYGEDFDHLAARSAAGRKLTELEQRGAGVEKAPTLRDAIPLYVKARNRHDETASRGGIGFTEDWDGALEKFIVMADTGKKKLMDLPLNLIRRDDILDARDTYAELTAKTDDEDEDGEEGMDIRRLRPMMSTINPMLRWFTLQDDWLRAGAIAKIVPPRYPGRARFLLPGEWQATTPVLDAMNDEGGQFIRFLISTGVRVEAALGMKWNEVKWGYPLVHVAEDGTKHEAYIWIIPLDRVKGGTKDSRGKLSNQPRRVLLIGESVKILKRLRAVYEADKTIRIKDHGMVFSSTIQNLWGTNRSRTQRDVEYDVGIFNVQVVDGKKKASLQSWHRHDLRRTHTVYLELMGCPMDLLSLTLMHKAERKETTGVAQATSHYVSGILAQEFLKDDILEKLAYWHLRLHALLDAIEKGLHTPDVQLIERAIGTGVESATLLKDQVSTATVLDAFKLDDRLVQIKKTKLKAVA